MSENEKVLLIDIDSLVYYEAHKEKLEWAIQGIDERMARIFKETGTTKYVAFLTEGKCFRYAKAVSKDYKGSRQGKIKPTWFATLKSYLKAKYGAYSISGLEADDCVAYFSQVMDDTIICSPDKDVVQQCIGTHYNYQMVGVKDDEGNKVEGAFESKGFVITTKEQALHFLHTQMLMGDSTDGISGIEKCGPKTAEKWLDECVASGNNVEQMILGKYVEKYGFVEGTSRFGETFKLVYLLRTPDDMLREIGQLPELPEVQEYIVEQESTEETVDWK